MNRFRVVTSALASKKKRIEELKSGLIRLRVFFPTPASRPQLDSTRTEPEDLLSQNLIVLFVLPEGDPCRIRALTHYYYKIS